MKAGSRTVVIGCARGMAPANQPVSPLDERGGVEHPAVLPAIPGLSGLGDAAG